MTDQTNWDSLQIINLWRLSITVNLTSKIFEIWLFKGFEVGVIRLVFTLHVLEALFIGNLPLGVLSFLSASSWQSTSSKYILCGSFTSFSFVIDI